MIKKTSLLVSVLLLISLFATGCSAFEAGIKEYSKDKEECVLNTDNITQFTYKEENYTILENTLSNAELGEWVGYIRKLAVVDSEGKILLQQDTEKATFKTLADIADSEPKAAYIVPFLNVYMIKNGDKRGLIVDANGGYHKAIPTNSVKDTDDIFHYEQQVEITGDKFTVNPQNCTQLICSNKIYQITEEIVPYEKVGDYLDIIAESYTFDDNTKLKIPKKDLLKIDWFGTGEDSQKREQWSLGDVCKISGVDVSDSVAVEINSEYRVAKGQ